MQAVLVANPKGGSGKTTIATNLAAGLAYAGERVCLWDFDRQHSALEWLRGRPTHVPHIARLDERDRAPDKANWLVLDSPAALHGKRLRELLKLADKVLVPIQASLFDIAATREFLSDLAAEKSIRKERATVGVIGSRIDPRTRAAAHLNGHLQKLEMPLIGWVHDTALYVNAAFDGLSVFDLPPHQSELEIAQWAPILEWVQA